MMTPEELQAAQAQITAVDTEAQALTQRERECIDKAREFNEETRKARSKRVGILEAIKSVRAAVAQHFADVTAAAKQAANEKAKAEAEAKAAAPKPPSEVELLRAEIAELKEIIVKQGE